LRRVVPHVDDGLTRLLVRGRRLPTVAVLLLLLLLLRVALLGVALLSVALLSVALLSVALLLLVTLLRRLLHALLRSRAGGRVRRRCTVSPTTSHHLSHHVSRYSRSHCAPTTVTTTAWFPSDEPTLCRPRRPGRTLGQTTSPNEKLYMLIGTSPYHTSN
jgi:hypothetical protein